MEWIEEADGVFRGGGVKGIALAGALDEMARHSERPVRRWENVAGASAGAIIACYLAVKGSAEGMVELLQETDYSEFADYRGGSLALAVASLPFRRSLARGDAFERWFDREVIEGKTFEAVRKPAEGDRERDWRLKLIAVDVTNRDLLVLPDDLPRYRVPGETEPIDPDGFKISRAARMSMSIPYFFEPVKLDHVEHGPSLIIDGGTLSNFPVWLFDVDPDRVGRKPKRPTFGLTLSGGRASTLSRVSRLLPWHARFGIDIFRTAMEAWDERFVSQSTRVRTLAVDAGDVGTTDFDLDDDSESELLENGREAAREFLARFDLDRYMNTFAAPLAAGGD